VNDRCAVRKWTLCTARGQFVPRPELPISLTGLAARTARLWSAFDSLMLKTYKAL